MIVRALDVLHDWTFGQGLNNYFRNNKAIVQSINTRLQCFLGDCFFDLGSGIDWFNYLGSKNSALALNLAVSATIINTENVTALQQLSLNLNDATRVLTITYQVQTVYSVTNSVFTFDTNSIG